MSVLVNGVALILENTWHYTREGAPWLLAGFIFAAILKAFLPAGILRKALGGSSLKQILLATAIGIPLPLCSCGVIPTGISMFKQGASKSATLAFFVATPSTTVTTVFLTAGMLGWKFTAAEILICFTVALLTGLSASFLLERGRECCESGERRAGRRDEGEEGEGGEEEKRCECEERKGESSMQGGACVACAEDMSVEGKGEKKRGEVVKRAPEIVEKMRRVFRGCVEEVEDIGLLILLGLLLAGFVSALLPADFFGRFGVDGVGGGVVPMLLMLLVGMPMYICSTASVPFVAALISKGMPPCAGLVFLVAGPATNLSTMLVIGRKMGVKTAFLYVICIAIFTVLMAYIFHLWWQL